MGFNNKTPIPNFKSGQMIQKQVKKQKEPYDKYKRKSAIRRRDSVQYQYLYIANYKKSTDWRKFFGRLYHVNLVERKNIYE